MKHRAILISLVGLTLGIVLILLQLRGGPAVGSTAPDFTLPDLDGKLYTLSDFRGKVVFLNFWTTWCPPCRTEMPAMERLYRKLRKRGFEILAVNQDADNVGNVPSFVDQLGLSFPVLLDPSGHLYGEYGLTGFPETFIIDPTGLIVRHKAGPDDWDSNEMLTYILAMMNRGPARAAAEGTGKSPAE